MRTLRGHGGGYRGPRYVVDADSGCWIWRWHLSVKGYGTIRDGLAHRVMWEDVHGPVPPGLELDHLCRNRACVNPDHLEPVTHAVNVGRGARPKLTAADKRLIQTWTGSNAELGRRLGVHATTIARARKMA